MTPEMNVAALERWVNAIGGAALAAFALTRMKEERSLAGAVAAAAGGGLIIRGATGYCPVYDAAGISTAYNRHDTKVALSGSRGFHVEEAVTIAREAAELYAFWRSFRNLPRFMDHLVSVEPIDGWKTHWVAKAPRGRTVRWDAEVISDVPGELIGWRTLPDSQVVSAGSVRFKPVSRGRGTEVRVHLQYKPAAGRAGAAVAWLFGYAPSQTIREDLRRFKQLMEAGEVPTTGGQPRGKR
jgi:uncharacterized membrane protein